MTEAPLMTNPGLRETTTLADIAKAANLSIGTISRALADSPRVTEETKELVRRIAREKNFRINAAARNLRKQTSNAIALVLPVERESGQMVSDLFFLDIIGAVADGLQGTGYDLLLSTMGQHPGQWYEDFIASRRADGLIVVGQAYHRDELVAFAQSNAPVVVWGAPSESLPYCAVGCDNFSGGNLATRHLLDTGRRRIVFLGDRTLPEVALRFDGYKQALADSGLSVDDQLLVASPFTREGAQEAVTTLVQSSVSFDAIFACSDLIAMSAIRVLQAHGRNVPADVAVVGFDDVRIAADYNPPLTTVGQNIPDGGKLLVSKLLSLIRGESALSEALKPRLIVRASSILA